jgi:predicted ATPase
VERYASRVPVSSAFATVVLQRLRGFNRAERTVLMRASVIGRRFALALLAAAAGMDENRLREILEKACSMQLVVRERPDGDWYAFRHALIRDIAHDEFIATLLRPTHRLIARAIECGQTSESSLDDLAYHWWAARDAARCVRYNERAGDRAAAAFATQEAQIYYDRAREFAGSNSARYRRLTGKITGLKDE